MREPHFHILFCVTIQYRSPPKRGLAVLRLPILYIVPTLIAKTANQLGLEASPAF